jgi:hypothetical protein
MLVPKLCRLGNPKLQGEFMTLSRPGRFSVIARGLTVQTAFILALAGAPARAAVLHTFDFSTEPDGDAGPWLQKSGFQYELDAKKLDAKFKDRRLVLATTDNIAGLFINEVNVPNVKSVRISWGVNLYPDGADWEKGNYRVPIAVVISFGSKKIDSGLPFLPDAPYFISPFLSRNAVAGRIYTAKYFKKGGRYVCNPCAPDAGTLVTTTIDLAAIYNTQFEPGALPPVTGFSFQMNTKDTRGGASAFLQKVEFLSD